MAPPFENRYRKSEVKTEKDCWTCRKSTKTCLLTDNYANGGDFLYTCNLHLKDHNFAVAEPILTEAAHAASTSGLSQGDIDEAIREYKERQEKKAQKGDKDDKDKENKDGEKDKSKDSGKKTDKSTKSPAPPAPIPEPTHYMLHKSFYEMRLRLHNQKKQQREAQARRSQLSFPSAPSDKPGSVAVKPPTE